MASERRLGGTMQFSPMALRRLCRFVAGLTAGFGLSGCISLPPLPLDEEARVRAQVAEQARQAQRPSSACPAQQGSPFAYRKKLLVLSFPLARPLEGADIPGLATTWSQALQKRLAATDRFLVRDGSGFRLDPADDPRTQIITLAREFDAQLVVAGRIDNLRSEEKVMRIGAFKPLPLPGDDRRTIESSLEVYDGATGTRIRHTAFSALLEGIVLNPLRSPLQGDFGDSELGKALAAMVHGQGEAVEDELACLPMQARIVRTERHEVHIDAGFSSGLQPGDRLKVVQRAGGGEHAAELRYGDLIISQVLPESAVGYLDGGAQPDWRFNGFVRAW